MNRPPLARLLPVLLLLAGACERAPQGDEAAAGPPPVAFDTGAVRILTATDTLALRVEVAETDAQRAYGLMERASLPQDAGMVFLYDEDQPAEAGFWMFHTRIPLDIAYIDAGGRIVAIERMEPCVSPNPQFCPAYPPGVPYRTTLEVNAGYFARHGVGVGDRVEFSR